MEQIQQKNSTRIDRYHAITVPLALWLTRKQSPRILSFGCSRGDELLPFAISTCGSILGVDIDEPSIVAARKKLRLIPNAKFETSSWRVIKEEGPYDIIMANAVLCAHPVDETVDDLTPHFSFA